MQKDDFKEFSGGGMDTDSAFEYVAKNDFIFAQNFRGTGTNGQDAGRRSNIEGTEILLGDLLAGINGCIGGAKFDDIGAVVVARYNSAGNHQILLYSYANQTYTDIYTDITDSGGVGLLNWTPSNWITFALINKTYLFWWDTGLEVGYTNLNTLISGGYGVVTAEDLSLLKPPCLAPPTGTYGSDGGKPANYWYSNLPVFAVQYVNADYNYSAWSTRSRRIVPYQENTPTSGANVGQNNYIIIAVNAGSQRAATINIARQINDETLFYIIRSVNRSYVLALPNTAVNVATEVYEAYDPTTNTYYYASYGNEIPIPVPAEETNLLYDEIWPSNAGAVVNGNIFALADWKTLYARPLIGAQIQAGGYNPNITIPAGTYTNPLTMYNKFYGASGSGQGNHKRLMYFSLAGSPKTNDTIVIIDADIRNSSATLNYSYVVPSVQNGNLLAVVQSIVQGLPNSSYTTAVNGGYTISWVDGPYYSAQTLAVQLYYAGANVANSIPSILDNTSYQVALAFYDIGGRAFPIDAENTYIVNTPSFAQVQGNAIQIQWTIPAGVVVPQGAVSYQWLITLPPVNKILDTIATPLNFSGPWDAHTNTPALSVNMSGENVGTTYQITVANAPGTPSYVNLGTNATYNTGDYIVYNGQSWDIVSKDIGDLTATGNIMAFSLNSLKIFNKTYNEEGVTTNLVYDYAVGDRCTLHYYLTGTTPTWFNTPCIDAVVFGYDAGNYIVKVEKSSALTYSTGNISYNGTNIVGKNVFLRLYSPALLTQQNSDTQQDIVWYEVGSQYSCAGGAFSTLSGIITDGGVYFKTRQFDDALLPYNNNPIQTIATDLNYSDFYPSSYTSFGRPRTYSDQLEQTERSANIIASQNYILGSKNNGLNRYYPSAIYGDANGQTSSSKGRVNILWQRGSVLVVGQELDFFYIPVNIAWTQLNTDQTEESNSMQLFNPGRYETRGIGISTKPSWCTRYDEGYFVDVNKSLVYQIALDGVLPISMKMDKFFKSSLQAAYQSGSRILMFYDDYYEEVVLCIQPPLAQVTAITFDANGWDVTNENLPFIPTPSDIINVINGVHCTVSYNSATGIATYTPSANYVGGDNATFQFGPPAHLTTINVCLAWVAGNLTPNNFSFAPVKNANVGTTYVSNTILVQGTNIPSPISVTGGSYSINGGAFTNSTGTVPPNATVQVNNMSSNLYNTETDTTLTIGGVSATYRVTTAASTVVTQTFYIYNTSTANSIYFNFFIDGINFGSGRSIAANGNTTIVCSYTGTSSSVVRVEVTFGYAPTSASLGYRVGTVAGVITGSLPAVEINFSPIDLTVTQSLNIYLNP